MIRVKKKIENIILCGRSRSVAKWGELFQGCRLVLEVKVQLLFYSTDHLVSHSWSTFNASIDMNVLIDKNNIPTVLIKSVFSKAHACEQEVDYDTQVHIWQETSHHRA